jgi:hypothetical protein
MTLRPRGTSTLAVLAASALMLLAGSGAASAATPSDASNTAYIRAGHLIPGFGGVTMSATLTAYDGSTRPLTLAPKATYGTLSAYEPLPVGYYSVAVRPLGAAADSPPVLTGTLAAAAGDAYTITGLGDSTSPRLQTIQDDITPPPPGTAKVRVLPVARPAQTTDVSVVGGPQVAQAAAFSQPTPYTSVAPGDVAVKVSTAGVSTQVSADLKGGSVYTLLVLDDGKGGLTVRPVLDATGSGVVPSGGAQTGAGGLATRSPEHSPALAAGGVAVAAAGAGVLLLAGRRRSGRHLERATR